MRLNLERTVQCELVSAIVGENHLVRGCQAREIRECQNQIHVGRNETDKFPEKKKRRTRKQYEARGYRPLDPHPQHKLADVNSSRVLRPHTSRPRRPRQEPCPRRKRKEGRQRTSNPIHSKCLLGHRGQVIATHPCRLFVLVVALVVDRKASGVDR